MTKKEDDYCPGSKIWPDNDNEIKGFELPEWGINSQFVTSLFDFNAEDITINLILIKGIQSLIADVSLKKAEELSNEFLADIEWTKDQLSKAETALEWANFAIFELEEKLKKKVVKNE